MNSLSHKDHLSQSPGRWKWPGFLMSPRFVGATLALGLIIRLTIALALPVDQFSDSAWYALRASELAGGMGYQEGGHPTAYWPVGWPAVLASIHWLIGSMDWAVLSINLSSSLVIMVLVYWFGAQIAANELAGRIALLAYALYPSHIAYTGVSATEVFFTAVLMSAFALLIAYRERVLPLFASGLLFGIATLVKPQTIAFPLGAVIALFLVFRAFSPGAALRSLAIVYFTLFLVVLPWTYRNYLTFDKPILVSTNGGGALLVGANDYMTGGAMTIRKTPVFKELGVPWEDRVSRQVELDERKKAHAVSWIKENTLQWFSWMPIKLGKLWARDTDGFWTIEKNYDSGTSVAIAMAIKIYNQVFYFVVLALAMVSAPFAVIGLFRQREPLARLGLLFCMPIFVSLLAMVFTGQTRYHFPAMPFLFVAAAWSLWRISVSPASTVEEYGALNVPDAVASSDGEQGTRPL